MSTTHWCCLYFWPSINQYPSNSWCKQTSSWLLTKTHYVNSHFSTFAFGKLFLLLPHVIYALILFRLCIFWMVGYVYICCYSGFKCQNTGAHIFLLATVCTGKEKSGTTWCWWDAEKSATTLDQNEVLTVWSCCYIMSCNYEQNITSVTDPAET